MILDLHRQGLSVSAIARQLECDRKTVRKYIDRGLAAVVPVPTQMPMVTVNAPDPAADDGLLRKPTNTATLT
jgi:transposase-like protein